MSEASAKAFVRHWVDVLNYAARSGATDELRALSSDTCIACEGAVASIDEVYGAGGSMSGDGWSIATVKYQPLQPTRHPVLTVGLDIAPQRVVPGHGKASKRFEGGRRTMTFYLDRATGTSWVVARLEQSL